MTERQGAGEASLLRITLIGVAAGLLSGLFGVGGGILIAPALVLLARMDQRMAHGTSLGAVLPISVSSLFTYWAHDHVDWRVAACLALGSVLGALVGTRLLNVLPHRTLAISFATLLVVTAVRLFLPLASGERGALSAVEILVLGLIGFGAGTLAGLLGVGGGVVMVPAMLMYLNMPAVVAKGTSVAVIIPTSIIGTWRNRRNDNADLRAAAILGFSGIATAVVGGWISGRMPDTLSNVLFAALLLLVAARLIADVRSRAVH
ncbi:MAG: sulfite exporter TauE/SafE family protein [Ilumatobacteraceae bacterium]